MVHATWLYIGMVFENHKKFARFSGIILLSLIIFKIEFPNWIPDIIPSLSMHNTYLHKHYKYSQPHLSYV